MFLDVSYYVPWLFPLALLQPHVKKERGMEEEGEGGRDGEKRGGRKGMEGEKEGGKIKEGTEREEDRADKQGKWGAQWL